MTQEKLHEKSNTALLCFYFVLYTTFLSDNFIKTFSLPLEAMAFEEILILVAIAIEDVDIDIAMDTTHLTIRTKLPVS